MKYYLAKWLAGVGCYLLIVALAWAGVIWAPEYTAPIGVLAIGLGVILAALLGE